MSDAVWVPVNAEMKGFVATLVKEASGAATRGSKAIEKEFAAGGKRAGEAVADGLASSAKKIEQISTKLGTARKAEAAAAADVTVAEQRLKNLRDSGTATASQIAAVEQQIETAKLKQANASARVTREEQSLDAVRSGGSATSLALSRAEDGLANARVEQTTATGRLKTAELQIEEARATAKAKADAVVAAENKLMDVRDLYGANTKQTARAERELEQAKKQAASANDKVAAAEGQAKKKRAELESATDKLKAKEMTLKAVNEDLAESTRKAAREQETFKGKLEQTAGKVASTADKLKLPATAVLGGMGLIARQSIAYASEAEQSYGAVESIFGDHAQGIIDASRGAADAVGLSGREYRELSASTGAMLSNMGMPMDQVAGKSQNLIGIAADLAATFGGTTADAIEAVNSLLRGETDPIERYGVSIKQADIDARLAAQGLDKLEGSAGKQARAQALLGLLTEQTAKAQGQFGRETDTAAHKQQVATAKFNDAKEAIGTGLLPIFAELASMGATVAGVIGEHPKLFLALGGAIAVAAGGILAIAGMSSVFAAISGAATAAGVSVGAFMTSILTTAGIVLGVVAAVAAVGVALWAFFAKTETGRQLWEKFTQAIGAGWDWVKEKLGAGIEWVKTAFSGIKSLFVDGDFSGALRKAFGVEEDSPIVGFFLNLRDTAIQAFDWIKLKLTEFGTGFMQFYTTWIQPVVTFMSTAFQMFGTVISTIWSGVIMPVLSFFGSMLQTLGSVVMSVVQAVIVPIWNFLGAQFSNIYNNLIRPIFGFFQSAAGLLADVLTGNFSNIRNRFSEMGQAIAGVVRGAITTAMNTFKNIVRLVGDAFNNFKALVASAMSAVVGKIQDMVGKVTAIPGKIKSAFSSAGSWLSSAGRDLISGFANGIRSASGWIVDAIKSLVPDQLEHFLPFADGGFFFANGGTREDHRAHIAPAGSWRIFGEPETGGEAYIPLAASKRKRSEAIANYVAEKFGYTMVDKRTGQPYDGNYRGKLAPAGGPSLTQAFADGGVTGDDLMKFVQGKRVRGHQASRPLEGAPYIWGGGHPNWGDCSGTVSTVAAFAVGQNPAPRRFATGSEASWLTSHGFKRGRGGKGDLRIGMKDGGPAGGHTSGTLPNGVNFEMGGGRGNGQVGGNAAGAWDSYYNEFFYRTIAKPKPPKPKYTPVSADSTAGMTVVDAETLDASTGTTGSETVTVALSPEDAAKATAAKELGDQSILDLAVDGIFDALGMGDSLTKKLLTSKGSDLFPSGDSIITTRDQARTSKAAQSAKAVEAKAADKVDPVQAAKDPQLGGGKPKENLPKWGPDFFAREIARSAKDHKLPIKGAMIGEAVALVESGDPLKMWANRAVPESLKFRHDAIGSDHDSIGLFQQRQAGWGTVKQRMTPYDSAGMFFKAMLQKFPNWQTMAPGAVAQGVQVSAFPDRYATKMDRGLALAKKSGVFDLGGIGYGKGIMPKDVVAPERVLSPRQTQAFDDLVYKQLPKQNSDGGGTTVVINIDGQEVLRKRVDKVEGQVNLNTEDLKSLRRRTSVAVAGTTRGGAV